MNGSSDLNKCRINDEPEWGRKHVLLVKNALLFQAVYDFLLVERYLMPRARALSVNGYQNHFQSSGCSKQTMTVDLRWLGTVWIDRCTQEIVYDSIYTILH